MYQPFGKRCFDLIVSVIAFIILLPFILFIFILIRIKLGNPAIFKQARPGLDGKIFIIYKFRTMKNMCDARGQLLSDGERLTKFGQILRKLSLDELPELLNVIKGEMSLVGPRPLLTEYLSHYTPEQARRHQVKPGMTGLAQVLGRNELTWEEKFKLDVRYVETLSFWLDIKILFKTFSAVLKSQGINAQGHATMPKFRDEKKEEFLN